MVLQVARFCHLSRVLTAVLVLVVATEIVSEPALVY